MACSQVEGVAEVHSLALTQLAFHPTHLSCRQSPQLDPLLVELQVEVLSQCLYAHQLAASSARIPVVELGWIPIPMLVVLDVPI